MINKELLSIIVCPQTHQRLSLSDDSLVKRLNELVRAGRLRNKVGQAVTARIEGALVREDQQVAYAIVDGIPILLMDEGIALDQLSG